MSKKISNPPPPPGSFKPPPPTAPPPPRYPPGVTVLVTDLTVGADQLAAFDSAGQAGPGVTLPVALAKVKELSSKLDSIRGPLYSLIDYARNTGYPDADVLDALCATIPEPPK